MRVSRHHSSSMRQRDTTDATHTRLTVRGKPSSLVSTSAGTGLFRGRIRPTLDGVPVSESTAQHSLPERLAGVPPRGLLVGPVLVSVVPSCGLLEKGSPVVLTPR